VFDSSWLFIYFYGSTPKAILKKSLTSWCVFKRLCSKCILMYCVVVKLWHSAMNNLDKLKSRHQNITSFKCRRKVNRWVILKFADRRRTPLYSLNCLLIRTFRTRWYQLYKKATRLMSKLVQRTVSRGVVTLSYVLTYARNRILILGSDLLVNDLTDAWRTSGRVQFNTSCFSQAFGKIVPQSDFEYFIWICNSLLN
jgi:hypothetical protein